MISQLQKAVLSVALLASVSACGQSTQTDLLADSDSGNRPTAFNDGSVLEITNLITGKNETESDSYWQCDVDTNGAISKLPLRFWADGHGFAGSRAMEWKSIATDKLQMIFANSQTTISNLTITGSGADSTLVASDAFNNPMSCQWAGPELNYRPATPLADETQGLEHFLTGYGKETNQITWSCTFTDLQNNAVNRQIKLNANKSGSLDDTEANWFIDDRYKLIIVTEIEKLYIHDIQFNSPENTVINARSKSQQVLCNKL